MFDNIKTLLTIKQKYEEVQIDMVYEIVVGGIQEGDFKELPVEMIRKFSFLAITAFRGLEYPLSIKPLDLNIDSYFEEMVDMLIEGIGKK
jgi:hypothetical protein